jgi:hypothetical protein
MPPKILKYEKSCERLYGDIKALDLSKPATKKQFMDLIATFLKDQPIDKKKESVPVEPILVDLPSIKKKRATARKPKESENEEGEAKAKKKTVIAPAPVPEKKAKKSTSAKKAKNA